MIFMFSSIMTSFSLSEVLHKDLSFQCFKLRFIIIITNCEVNWMNGVVLMFVSLFPFSVRLFNRNVKFFLVSFLENMFCQSPSRAHHTSVLWLKPTPYYLKIILLLLEHFFHISFILCPEQFHKLILGLSQRKLLLAFSLMQSSYTGVGQGSISSYRVVSSFIKLFCRTCSNQQSILSIWHVYL